MNAANPFRSLLATIDALGKDVPADDTPLRAIMPGIWPELGELRSFIISHDALMAAAQKALYEMRHTVAPRDSFTDAVDALDAALSEEQGND